MGAEVGLRFQPRSVGANSRKALEAAEFARAAGGQQFDRLHRRLFQAYFEEGENIGLTDVLCRLAAECGLHADRLREALEGGAYSKRVDDDVAWARNIGVTGTPTFLIGEKYAIVGAQEYAVFEQVMSELGVPRKDAAAG